MIKCVNEAIPKFLQKAEGLLSKQEGDFFLGSKVRKTKTHYEGNYEKITVLLYQLSWADLAMFDALDSLTSPTSPYFSKRMTDLNTEVRVKFLDNCPELRRLMTRVAEQPGVKEWLKTRPSDEEEPF